MTVSNRRRNVGFLRGPKYWPFSCLTELCAEFPEDFVVEQISLDVPLPQHPVALRLAVLQFLITHAIAVNQPHRCRTFDEIRHRLNYKKTITFHVGAGPNGDESSLGEFRGKDHVINFCIEPFSGLPPFQATLARDD